MKYKTLLLFLLLAICKAATAKEAPGYRIQVNAPLYKGSTVYLAKYRDGKPYIQDSTQISDNGQAVLASNQKLLAGQYLVYCRPDIQLDLLIDTQQSAIEINVNKDKTPAFSIKGSKDSELLWKYLFDMQDRDMAKAKLEAQLKDKKAPEEAVQKELKALNTNTQKYIDALLKKHKNDWFGIYLRGMQTVLPPTGIDLTANEPAKYKAFLKNHFFDNINLTDPRLWRTSYFTQTIDNYMTNYVENVPDSLAEAASKLVAKTKGDTSCFKEMLSKLTNESIQSKVMGRENIWARLAEDYIFDKDIAWIDSTQMQSLRMAYGPIKNNRIGMVATDITLETIDGNAISIYDIDANYTLLYFYSPSCGHCRTETPLIHNDLYRKYKDKLEIVAINISTDKEEWTSFIDELKITDWINCADMDYKSSYWMYYDVSGTPALFLLDKDKKIIAKKIDEKSLDYILNYYINNKNGIN